ncbi:MAG: hypothetical protein HY401_03630, partial [Elusimicrobia bacterium]|nr:hypothetical protein [Elusimicrobiota bacterium]
MPEKELQDEILDYARRRYHAEKRELLDVLALKEKEMEELKETIRHFETRIEELAAALDSEKAFRYGDLATRQAEIEKLYKEFAMVGQGKDDELELERLSNRKMQERVNELKEEIKTLLEKNRRAVAGLTEEVSQKEIEISRLKTRERELQAQILAVESTAQEQNGKLNKKVLELEELLKKIQEESKAALAAGTASLIEERANKKILQEKTEELAKAVERMETEKKKILEDWERERAKWQELWERERKVWENQKGDFSDWQEKHLREKAVWERMLREKEAKEIHLTHVFGRLVSEFGRWAALLRGGEGARG